MKKYLSLLKNNRNYSLILIADLISNMGDILFTFAISWKVLEATSSVLMASSVYFFEYLAKAFFSLVSGIIIDRISRKKLILLGMTVQAAVLMIFIPFIKQSGYGISSLSLIFILYIFSTLVKSSQNAMIPDYVSKEQLITANSFDVIVNRVASMCMLAIAGIIVVNVDMSLILMINAVSFIIPAILIWRLLPEIKLPDKKDKKGVKHELKDGISFIKSDSFVKSFVIMLVILNFPYSIMNTFPLAYSNIILGINAAEFGFIKTAVFISSILAMYLIGSREIFNKKPVLFFNIGVLGCGLIMLFFIPVFKNNLFTTALIFMVYEFFDMLTQPVYILLRGKIPTEIRGRVYGIIDAVILTAVPVYTLISGYIMDKAGIHVMAYILSTAFVICFFIGRKMFKQDI